MGTLAAAAFVLAAGLTFCGLVGATIELIAGRRLSLGEPFVSADNLSRSLVLVLLAGPFMTLNEAILAAKEERIGWAAFVGAVCFLTFWLAAVGVFVLGLVESARDPVG
jgi:hypothetical protein